MIYSIISRIATSHANQLVTYEIAAESPKAAMDNYYKTRAPEEEFITIEQIEDPIIFHDKNTGSITKVYCSRPGAKVNPDTRA